MRSRGIVAIVGRPNVGKSTLFNRLTKSSNAIVDDRPGVTRDRIYGYVKRVNPTEHLDTYVVIDTGGFETDDFNFQPFGENIVWQQTQQAVKESDVVVFVLDGKEGLCPHDRQIADFLRRAGKPVIFVVNKVDGKEQEVNCFEFFEISGDDLMYVSAAHNRAVWELSDKIEAHIDEIEPLQKAQSIEEVTNIAIIGRPNVGKSSILNRLVGSERSIVSDVAGTTRDAVDACITYNKKLYKVIDTAGIRRKSRINEKLENLSVVRSLRSIEDAEVVILVLGPEGLTDQDARLASLTLDRHKPLLVVVNKWDLVEEKSTNLMRDIDQLIHRQLKTADQFPILFTSCLENKRVHKIMTEVENLAVAYRQRVSTAKVNECLQKAVAMHTPALVRKYNKRVKFFYATQVGVAPPTIVIKCNVATEIQESYKRYLKRQFRTNLDFGNVPLRIIFRDKQEKK